MNSSTVDSLVSDYNDLQRRVDDFKSVLKNKSIPLDERWDSFTKLVESGVLNDIENYGDGFVDTLKLGSGGELTPYDDFYIERHETSLYTDLFEKIDEDPEIDLDSVVKWKEEVLSKGSAGFVYDW